MKQTGKKRISTAAIVVAIEMMLILFSIVTSSIILYNDMKRYREENRDYIKNIFIQNQKRLEESRESFASFCYEMMISESIQFLKGHYYEMKDDYYSKSLLINDCQSRLNALIAYYPETYCAHLFIEGDEYEDTLISTMSNSYEQNAFLNLMEDYSIQKTFYTYDGNIYFMYGDEHLSSIIAIKLSDDYLVNFLSQIGTLYENNLTKKYVDEEGKIYYITTNLSNYQNQLEKNKNNFTEDGNIVKNDIFIKYTYLDAFDLYAAISLNNSISHIVTPILIMLVVVIVCEIVVGLLLTYNFASKPMKRIIKSMYEIEQGNFNVQIQDKTISDFQQIYDGFNKMTASLNSYINENYIQQLQIKESEFKFLQSQINPHFLYNCFANISSLCQIGDNKTALALTRHLSKYYFYITESQPIVPLKDEMANMMHFLQIQKIRFGERVAYDIEDIKPEDAEIMVPKLILQPIVENSFKYVFSKIPHGGLLKLTTDKNKDYLFIRISDNGDLLTLEDIDRLNNKIKNASLLGQHGLTNIYRRLEYFSNGKSTLRLCLNQPQGLMVEIKIYIGEKKDG